MAERWEEFDFTMTAGQTKVSNVVFTSDVGEVVEIKVRIPNGHAGKATMQILYSGTQAIPKSPGAVIKGNAQTLRFPVDNFPVGEGWQCAGFNGGTVSHTFQVFFGIDEIIPVVAGDLPPLILLPTQLG